MSARAAVWGALVGVALLWVAAAGAQPNPAAVMARVHAAWERGALSEAIDELEFLSDQGVVHPAVSFNRGLAYLRRAESPHAQRNDWGQAVAGFEEALALEPSDSEAELLLERVREAMAQRRARQSNEPLMARPRLLRAVLGLIGENVWAAVALFGSALLTVALGLRFWSRGSSLRLTAGVLGAIGIVLLPLGAGMAAGARRLRLGTTPAVVVNEQAALLDAAGRPVSAAAPREAGGVVGSAAIPEGSAVYIKETRGSLAFVEWGDNDVWVSLRDLRRLATR